jgi:lipopolysaccharide assembly protein A
MQFLKTLFWIVITVALTLVGYNNWYSIDISLGDVIVSVRMPALVFAAFLLGFLPTLLLYRARLWSMQRRLDVQVQAHAVSHPAPVPTGNAPNRPTAGAPAE